MTMKGSNALLQFGLWVTKRVEDWVGKLVYYLERMEKKNKDDDRKIAEGKER